MPDNNHVDHENAAPPLAMPKHQRKRTRPATTEETAAASPPTKKKSRTSKKNDNHPLVLALRRVDPVLQFLTKATGQAVVPIQMLQKALPTGLCSNSSSDNAAAAANGDASASFQTLHALVRIGVLHAQRGNGDDDPSQPLNWEEDAASLIHIGFPPPESSSVPTNTNNNASDDEQHAMAWHEIRQTIGGTLHGSTKTAAKRRLRALQRFLQQFPDFSIGPQNTATKTTTHEVTPEKNAVSMQAVVTTPPSNNQDNTEYLDGTSFATPQEEKVEEESFVEGERNALTALCNLFGFSDDDPKSKKQPANETAFGSPSSSTMAKNNRSKQAIIPDRILPKQVGYAGSMAAQSKQFGSLPPNLAATIPKALWKAFGLHNTNNNNNAPREHGMAGTPAQQHRRQLYQHQARAITSALQGTHTLVCTGTGSGKSLCFWLPVLTAAYNSDNPESTEEAISIILFPTKALAQDQYQKLEALLNENHELRQRIRVATLDGDTPHAERTKIANDCNIILTNPDALHAAILPNWKTTYKKLFGLSSDDDASVEGRRKRLRYVVVDEAHLYEGVFGAHVAMILVRLLRVCAAAAATNGFEAHCPTFLAASATLPWPRQHFHQLFPIPKAPTGDPGQDTVVDVVVEDTSPRSSKHFFVWNPPILQQGGQSLGRVTFPAPKKKREEAQNGSEDLSKDRLASVSTGDVGVCIPIDETGKSQTTNPPPTAVLPAKGGRGKRQNVFHRRHAADETAILFVRAIQQGIRCIAFAKTRNLVEWIYEKALNLVDARLKTKIESYRGGYSRAERRKIEERLFSNDVLGVVATNALELGVDVGGIDLTLHCGYPSSYASLLQQAGRSGRGSPTESCAVVVCFNSPSEQHLWKSPKSLLAKGLSSANTIPLNSPGLVQGHLLCGAQEHPLAGHHSIPDIYNRGSKEILTDSLLFGGKAIYEESLNELKTSGCVVSMPRRALITTSDDEEMILFKAHSSMKKAWSKVAIRAIEPINFAIVDLSHPMQGRRQDAICSEDAILDIVPYSRVFYHAHPGAIISHRGQKYKVVSMMRPPPFAAESFSYRRSLSLASFAKPTNARYTTRPLSTMQITVIKQLMRVDFPPGEKKSTGSLQNLSNGVDDELLVLASFAGCGAVSVKRSVHGYKKLSLINRTEIGRSEISLPDMEWDSFGLWMDADAGILQPLLGRDRYGEGCHALAHAILAVAPLFVPGLSRTDLECDHNVHSPTRITIFDERAGGSGSSERLWKHFFRKDGILEAAIELLEGCNSCGWDSSYDGGCPACLHASECLKFNMNLSKSAAIIIGKRMLERLQETSQYKENLAKSQVSPGHEPLSPSAAELTPRRRALRQAKELRPARQRQYMVGRPSWPFQGDSIIDERAPLGREQE